MDLDGARRSLDWRQHLLRRRLRELGARTRVERTDLRLLSAAGYPLSARITRPVPRGEERRTALPGVVISPAIHQGLAELDTFASAVTAAEVARLGYAVLTFDPAGRGDSWGEEDFGGPEHQDDLRVAIRALMDAPDVTGVGVLSLSYGIVAAAPALAEPLDNRRVRWLVDWEGPSDREIITTGGTRLVPAAGHALDDEDYWRPREPVRHIGALRCGYVRLQAWPDHAQPGELRHAERMIDAAAKGTAPWFQINDHPRGTRPPRPLWLAGGAWNANAAILRKLSDLR